MSSFVKSLGRWWLLPAMFILVPAVAFGQVNLTFSVDMTQEILDGNFDPADQTVDVRGTFNGWSESEDWKLQPSEDNDSIYVGTFEFADADIGTTIEFKFVAHDWEGAIGNRMYTITDDEDQELPLAVFNVPYWLDITFYVDMSDAIDDGDFNVDQDSVVMRGYFQELAGDTVVWAGNRFLLEPVEYNDEENVYGITIRFDGDAAGVETEWKFVIVGPDKDDIWESIGNRSWELAGDQVQELPLFHWDTPFGESAMVTFLVDMRAQMLAGNFDPDRGDRVYVRGEFNGWSQADTLYEDFEVEGWYEKQIEVTAGMGQQVEHKYFMEAGDGSAMPNGGWEFGANRTFEFTGENKVLDRRFWSDITLEGFLAQDVDVTFRFDKSTAVDDEGNPIEGDLYMAGANPPLFWIWDDTDADRSHLLLTETDQEGIYEVTLTFPEGSIRELEYKYAIEVQQNDFVQESGFQENRVVEIPLEVEWAIVVESGWGEWDTPADIITNVEQIDSGIPMVFSLEQNYPNPFNPATVIQYTVPQAEKVMLKIYNVLGQEVATLVNEVQNPGTYQATFDASRLASGVYIYRMQAGDFVESKRMMLIK